MERGHGDELLSEKRKACFQELAPGGWQAEWCRMLELTSNFTLFYNKLEKGNPPPLPFGCAHGKPPAPCNS
ncbi:hypothetical protein KY284_008305 [Solanum tuberosum]|nr:hypothetical protein KY284_008305 [Solanum tuberosum]